jgi:hypothetical protein
MFNFDAAKKSAAKALKNPLLELIVLGSQGAGKSYCIGTLGVKTLYLYGLRESHGPKTASVQGKANVEPMCIDYGVWPGEKDERAFTSDESLEFLRAILMDQAYIKSQAYKAIAVDGLAVLEAMVKGTQEWKEKCRTTAGKHNTYKETEATQEILGEVIGLLKACQRELGTHIVVTGVLDVKSTDAFGAIDEAAPRLGGYGLAESLNQHFGDIAVVGKMTRGGETKYKFQFLTDLTKVSKDESGNQKKAMNFSPRLSGLDIQEPTMPADLSLLAKLKADRMGK